MPECLIVNGGSGEAVTVAAILHELATSLGAEQGPRFMGAIRAGDPRDYQADMTRTLKLDGRPRRTGGRVFAAMSLGIALSTMR